MAKPSRWPAIKDPANDPRDNFDSSLPLGDIPVKKADTGNHYKPAVKPIFCEVCGGRDFWQLSEAGRWVCNTCRPQPQPSRTSMIKCLNELDDRGQPIPFETSEAIEARKAYELFKVQYEAVKKRPLGECLDFDTMLNNGATLDDIQKIITVNKPSDKLITKANRKPAQRKKAKTAEIWPLMGVHSWDTKHGGAWRLSVLFSSLDHNENCDHAAGVCYGGSGKIEREALEAAAIELGVKRSTFYLWLADAKKFGIFSGDGKYLYMASQQKIAEILFCNTIDQRKAIIPLKLLFKAGWKDIVWSAYIKVNHNKKNISDKTLEGITGVPQRTQRRLNTNVKVKKNFAQTQVDGTTGNLAAAKDNSQHKGYFIFNRKVAYTLPARRSVNDTYAKSSGKGRRYVILAKLNKLSVYGLYENGNHPFYSLQQATNSETDLTKLFYENNKKDTKQAARALQPLTRGKKSPREIYILQAQKFKCGVWDIGHVGAGISA